PGALSRRWSAVELEASPPPGARARLDGGAGACTARLFSYGATPRPGGGSAQRLEGQSVPAVAHPAAPRAVAGRSGAGHCGDAGALPRAPEHGAPHASHLLPQAAASHGLCDAAGPEAAERERRHREYRAPRRQLALARAKQLLVACPCRGHLALTRVRQGRAVDRVETYGHFTPGAARSLTGKMGTRASIPIVQSLRESNVSFVSTISRMIICIL